MGQLKFGRSVLSGSCVSRKKVLLFNWYQAAFERCVIDKNQATSICQQTVLLVSTSVYASFSTLTSQSCHKC